MKPNPLDYASPRPPGPGRRANPWVVGGLVTLLVLLVFFRLSPRRYHGPEWARIKAVHRDLSDIDTGLEAFHADTGRYPTAAEGIVVLVNPPAGAAGWKGPYLKRLPTDPWGRLYVYHAGGPGGGFVIGCLRPDGKEGTADDIGFLYDTPATGPAATQPGPLTQ